MTVADAAQDAVTATQSLRLCRGLSTELQLPKGGPSEERKERSERWTTYLRRRLLGTDSLGLYST